MKKLFLLFAIAGTMGLFASCDSPREEAAEDQTEEIDETADEIEDEY